MFVDVKRLLQTWPHPYLKDLQALHVNQEISQAIYVTQIQ